MNRAFQTDIGSVVTARAGSAIAALTAGGAGDNTAVNGGWIDRQALGLPLSALVVLLFDATLAAGKTLSITAFKVQDSADGVTGADFAVLDAPGVVATATGTGQTVAKLCLSGARRYVRVVFTPDLSAADTDTAKVAAAWTLGGFDTLPSPV